jgi:hypothetical protein
MVAGAVELPGWDLGEVEGLIEPLAEGGWPASDFTFSYHRGRSIPFKAGDVKGAMRRMREKGGGTGSGRAERGGEERFEAGRCLALPETTGQLVDNPWRYYPVNEWERHGVFGGDEFWVAGVWALWGHLSSEHVLKYLGRSCGVRTNYWAAPQGGAGVGRLASLLLSRRSTRDILLRRVRTDKNCPAARASQNR